MKSSVFEFEFELDPAGLWLISGAFLIGDAKTDEADGMGMIFHAVHQLFGKGKDVVLGTKDVVDGDAASDLLEVLELDFQRQGAAFEIVFLNTADEFEHSVIEVDGDIGILVNILFEGPLTTDRLALPFGNNGPIVDTSGDVDTQFDTTFVVCHIQKSLIERDGFYQVGIVVEDVM